MVLKVVASITSIVILCTYLLLLTLTSPWVCWLKYRPTDDRSTLSTPKNEIIERRKVHVCEYRSPLQLMPMPNSIKLDENSRLIHLPSAVILKSPRLLPYLPIVSSLNSTMTLVINYESNSAEIHHPDLMTDESYKLEIQSEERASLNASNFVGILRGLSTFRQLQAQETVPVPLLIQDEPNYAWRGLMLDVARHFIPISEVKQVLDQMFVVKLNVLHIHLSDDQGFRFESKKYPQLHDQKEFYSQSEMFELVEFARQRAIRIVPEFDVPCHTTSWFVNYPQLSSSVQKSIPIGSIWGVYNSSMDVANPLTYEFLGEFFKEVSQIFPDHFIHIGGDECMTYEWENSPSVRSFMDREKVRSYRNLHGYFNGKLQNLLSQLSREMIGWNEILDSPINNSAVIHVWTNREKLLEAINLGHRAILSRGFYLDHMAPTSFHYQQDMFLDFGLKNDRSTLFLGGEACLWTEYIDRRMVQSRLWPRTAAIAERFWSRSVDAIECLYDRLDLIHQRFFDPGDEQYLKDLSSLDSDVTAIRLLADFCEPLGLDGRNRELNYNKDTPLNRFVDFLRPESDRTRKLMETNNMTVLYSVFLSWINIKNQLKTTHPEIIQLAQNLAQLGEFGLNLLNTLSTIPDKRIVSSRWYYYHMRQLNLLENNVPEIRLAAARILRSLLIQCDPCSFDVINLILLLIFPLAVLFVRKVTYIRRRLLIPCLNCCFSLCKV